jgi:hypothetical protein
VAVAVVATIADIAGIASRRQRPPAIPEIERLRYLVIILGFLEKASESGRLQRMGTGGKLFG